MPLTFDFENLIIQIPKSYMVLIQTVPSEIYQLDLNSLRLDLKDFEDSETGMPMPDTHQHNTTVTVSGAILARVMQFINGWTITFEDGQYRVNTVGANSNIGDVVNVNQVSVSTSNSAGLQDLNSLQAASYAGGVAIDTTSQYSGTIFPVGTRAYPVNNTANAVSIATERGLKKLFVTAPLTLTSVDFSDGFIFQGDNPVVSTIHINDAANVSNCEFINVTVTGTIDNNNLVRQASIGDVTHVNGFMFQCSLMGTVTLGGGSQATILDCYSGIAGGGALQYPIIDMGGDGQSLAMRGFSGGLGLQNCTGSCTSSIDMNSGRVVIDSTISSGEFTIRGIADVIDNSTGTTVVTDDTVGVTVADIWGADPADYAEGTMGDRLDKTSHIEKSIYVNTELIDAGDGTFNFPFNTLSASLDKAELEGFKNIVTFADITLDRNVKNFFFRGIGHPRIDLNGQDVDRSVFSDVHITGTGIGRVHVQDSILELGVSGISGSFTRTGFKDTIVFGSQTKVIMAQCFSAMAGAARPHIYSPTGAGIEISIRWWSGGLTIHDMDNVGDKITVECTHGKVELDTSCTTGEASIRGLCVFDDNSTGTVVDTSALGQVLLWNEDISSVTGTDKSATILKDALKNAKNAFSVSAAGA